MMKFLLSKHSRSIFIFALLSLFLCMVAGKASAAGLNPVVKIDKTSYTSSGTEVTLRLWMFNWKKTTITTKDYNARFTGDVYLYIDDKEVGKLNEMWGLIAGSNYVLLQERPGTVGNSSVINLDGTNVGTAQFQDLKSGQTCPYNSNTTEKSWRTIDLKLSFNKSFSYYGHKITVKGKWQDRSSGSVVEKDVALDNTINGFVRPINLSAKPSGDKTMFSWEQEGYNKDASIDGKWIVYKREDGNNVKLGEVAANEHSLSIEKKQYSCSNGYIMTFLPNVCKGEETVCGLTTSLAATGHKPNVDDICQMCGHSFFRYHTSDGNMVNISNKDFGANVVSHEVVNSECVIEFDAPITRIPAQAFKESKIQGYLVIPNSVTTIDEEAFSNCTELNGSLTLSSNLKTIGNRAFNSCDRFKGNLTIPNSVTTIGDWAFSYCTGFTGDLTIPNSVTTIGNFAFYNCIGFTGDLTIPNSVITIGKSAFESCFGFTGKLAIPESVTTIGYLAFADCNGFTGDLSLPKSLEVVGSRSFENCNKIQTINFQSLPTGIDKQEKKTVSLSDDSYISDQTTGTADAISYTRQMSNDWGTLVLPYALTLTGNEPYRLYAIDKMDGEELVLKQLEGEVAAGTPCVVKRNGTESELTFGANDVKLNMAIDGKPVGGMKFCGTYWTKDVNSGYVISKNSFWNVEKLKGVDLVKGVKVKPFRAWLDGTSAKAPARLSMRIDGSTTGIDAIDALNDAEAEYYDLSGKRLDEPQKGVNIVRMKSGKTKKIIIK